MANPDTNMNFSPTRTERDSMGEVQVPADRYWGAQTERSLRNFEIGEDHFPRELLFALGLVKKAAALANEELGVLPREKTRFIVQAAQEVIEGELDDSFPLYVWQTGSGTHTNMNANEVIANRAMELAAQAGRSVFIHPNDDVNRGQSSNDTFPTAMHIAAVMSMTNRLLPKVILLIDSLQFRRERFGNLVKLGRTHLQDATPITVGQEVGGWLAQLSSAKRAIDAALPEIFRLALGGTAVGTGLNTHPRFAEVAIRHIAETTGLAFEEGPNKFELLSAHDALVTLHGGLKRLAVALMKIANDIRLLASGPRAGLAELSLPENEPGSSIMPGKVNPSQCEAMVMVCIEVLGNDAAVSIAGATGILQLNVNKPLLVFNVLRSARLLADAMESFRTKCVDGLEPREPRLKSNLEQSLMLVTALAPHVGYDKAAAIAHAAHERGCTLREAAVGYGGVSEADFDQWVRPEKMV